MTETIASIRRLENRYIFEEHGFLGPCATGLPGTREYPLDIQTDVLRPGMGILKVTSTKKIYGYVDDGDSDRRNNNHLREVHIGMEICDRYFLSHLDMVLPISRRAYRQGTWVEHGVYIRTLNVLLSQTCRPFAGSIIDGYILPPSRVEIIPLLLSSSDPVTEHSRAGLDSIDGLSLGGWIHSKHLTNYMTSKRIGMFDALPIWAPHVGQLLPRTATTLWDRLKYEDRIELVRTISSIISRLSITEFRADVVARHGTRFETSELKGFEYMTPFSVMMGNGSNRDLGLDPSTDAWIIQSDVQLSLQELASELVEYVRMSGIDPTNLYRMTVYRGIDDLVTIFLNESDDTGLPTADIGLSVDLGRCMIINPSIRALSW